MLSETYQVIFPKCWKNSHSVFDIRKILEMESTKLFFFKICKSQMQHIMTKVL